MGMPITTYHVLNALDKGEPEYEITAAQNALKPFNLFAFIIHDPEAHPDFDSGLRSIFNWLDYTTGKELLFFSLVDPPKEWLDEGRDRGRDRSYYRELSSWEKETQELFNPENAIISPDKSITAYSLANGLGISYDKLPCIVITPNFRSEHFIWVRTCLNQIQKQLEVLGFIAREMDEIPSDPDLLETIKADINLCEGGGIRFLVSNLAQKLVNIMSCFVAGDRSDLMRNLGAHERARNTIRELRRDLHNVKEEINNSGIEETEDNTEELDRICLQIIFSLSQLNLARSSLPPPSTTPIDIIDINLGIENALLEKDTQTILRTAGLALYPLLSNEQRGSNFDYTPGIICLAKAFEREVNLSVIHWIRQKCGVRLPQYFDRFDPRRSATYDTVNFNRSYDSQTWSPPTLGQSLEACKTLGTDSDSLNIDIPPSLYGNWRNFLNWWETITTERNKAAHETLVNKESLETVRRVLNRLSKKHIFEKLYEMKTDYRS